MASAFPAIAPGVDGETGAPLAGSESESEARTKAWCNAAFEEAEGDQKVSDELRMVGEYVKYLQGTQWPTAGPSYRAKPVNNRMNRLFWELVSTLTDIRPVVDVRSVDRGPKLIQEEETINNRMRIWWSNNDIDQKVAMSVVYAILTTSFAKLEWDPKMHMGRGDFVLHPMAPDAVLPLKPGTDLQSAEACIYQDIKSVGSVQRKYPTKAHLVYPDSDLSQYSIDSGPPRNITPAQFSVLSPAMKQVLSKGQFKTGSSAYPVVRYREFWMKDYCVSPSTRILTADLQWKPASSLRVGDELVGCDEESRETAVKNPKSSKKINCRWLRRTKIESITSLIQPCVRIVTDKGEATCSTLHRWLVKTTKQERVRTEEKTKKWWIMYAWKRAEDIEPGDKIAFLCNPWQVDESRDAGYLAGIFDGEGWCTKYDVGFAQKEGLVLNRTISLLQERGFAVGINGNGNSTAMQASVRGGREERMRFLGSVRPLRLLDKSGRLWEGKLAQGKSSCPAIVTKVEVLGEQEVLGIQTTARTFIAEGMISHNSVNESNRVVTIGDPNNPWKISYKVRPNEMLFPRGRLIVMAGKEIVHDGPNPYWHGLFPFSLLRMNVVPWSIYGMSDIKQWKDLQDIINQIFAGVINMIKRATNPPFYAPKTAFNDNVWDSIDFSMPGAKVAYNAMSPQEPRVVNVAPLPGFVLPMLQNVEREMDQQSGISAISEMVRKKQMPGGDTIDQIRQTQQTPIRLKGRNIETFLKNLGTQMVPNMFQFYTQDSRASMRTAGGKDMHVDWNLQDMVPQGMTPYDMAMRYEFQVMEGSLLSFQRTEMAISLMRLRITGDLDRKTYFEKLSQLGWIDLDAATVEKNLQAEMQNQVPLKGSRGASTSAVQAKPPR